MDTNINSSEDESKIIGTLNDKYNLYKILGRGGTSVVYLSDKITEEGNKEKVAVKVINIGNLPNNDIKTLIQKKVFQAEFKALSEIIHPNVMKIYDSGKGTLKTEKETKEGLDYLILEYIEKDDLYRYTINEEYLGFEEPYARNIFKQIVYGLQACHAANICHRDIKLENIMFDKDYNIKLCDFGFANNCEGPIKGLLKTILGTPMYKGPELCYKLPYDGKKVDIFALGVTLFTILTGKIGFKEATKNSDSYRLIMLKKWDNFWKQKGGRNNFPNGISDEFKDLYSKLVAFRPNDRISVDEILQHPWLKLKTATNEELIEELKRREEKMKLKEIKIDSNTQGSEKTYKDDSDDIYTYFSEQEPYCDENILNKENSILIEGDIDPIAVFNRYSNFVKKMENSSMQFNSKRLNITITFDEEEETKINPKELKEIAELNSAEDNEEPLEEELKIDIKYNINDDGNIQFISFEKISGNQIEYLNKISELKKEADKLILI